MDQITKDFGLYMKKKRLEKGLSQAEVAKKLNISQQAYGRYELGQRECGLRLLFEIGDVLGFEPGDFLNNYEVK
jgi:transcriptional regulator with XRE-family HTH domain